MVLLNDGRIAKLVMDALAADPRIDCREITVSVDSGTVHLHGMVDSAAERNAANETVGEMPEVERVVDHLILKNFIARTDSELTQSVRYALLRHEVADCHTVSVDAHDGVVYLSGTVTSQSLRREVENVALWTPGVLNVVSHIAVDGAPSPLEE